MGNSNQYPNTAFKQFKKEGFKDSQPRINPSSTFVDEREVLYRIYRVCIDQLRLPESEIDEKPLLASNEQKNAELESSEFKLHQAKKSLAQMSADFMSGFKNGEANIEELTQPIHEKFFTVLKHDEHAKDFQNLQKMRMLILHSLYQIKQKQSSKVSQPFKDYVAQFLEDRTDEDDISRSTKQVGFGFLVAMLSEMRTINNGSLLEHSLAQFLQILKRQGPGQMFEISTEGFDLEASLNEASQFLAELISDKATPAKTKILAAKTLLALGYARDSAEDILQLVLLIREQAQQGTSIDLTEELKLLQKHSSAGSSTDLKSLNEDDFNFSTIIRLMYLPPISMSDNKSFVVDGNFLFILNSD